MVRPGTEPPPAAASVSTTVARRDRRRDRRGAVAQLGDRRRRHAPERDRGAVVVEVRERDGFEPGERDLVGAQRARERMAREQRDEVGAADDDPGLRSAEQLVAREGDERRAGVEALAHARLVAEPRGRRRRATACARRAAPIPASTTTGGPERRELGDRRRLGEADHAVVRRVHLEHERGALGDRALVVGPAGAVGGADLDEPGAGLGEDLGNAEAAADLDQLAARHDHLAVARQRREHEQHRGRVVVDDEAGLGAAREREQRAAVVLARAARPGVEPVLDVGVAAGFGHRRRATASSGARPRFVWSSTPVALTTGRAARPVAPRSGPPRRRRLPRGRSTVSPAAAAPRGGAATASRALGDERMGQVRVGRSERREHPFDARECPPGVHGPAA